MCTVLEVQLHHTKLRGEKPSQIPQLTQHQTSNPIQEEFEHFQGW